jgi:hypothetical protein
MSAFIVNSFQIPNAFVDEAMSMISPAATVLYLFIVRKTRGWQKQADHISLSQFQKETSIKSRSTVVRALDELIQYGIVIKYDDHHQAKGNVYSLNDGSFASLKNGLVQNLDQNQSEIWTKASSNFGLTEIQLNTVNTKEEKTGFSEKAKSVTPVQEPKLKTKTKKTDAPSNHTKASASDIDPKSMVQRESPLLPEQALPQMGQIKPKYIEADAAALERLSSAEVYFYKSLRKLCIDLTADDPFIKFAVDHKLGLHVCSEITYQMMNCGYIRGQWYPIHAFQLKCIKQAGGVA